MEQIPETLELGEDSKKRKILLIVGAVVLLLIILPYFLTTTISRNTIGGLIESSTFEDLTIRNTNIPVTLSKEVQQKLLEFYEQNPELEFKACLKGYIQNNAYYINEVYQPTTYEQSVNHVRAEPCSEEDLISLHSHPKPHCLPSEQDLRNHENMKKLNPQALLAVMCTENRLNIYN